MESIKCIEIFGGGARVAYNRKNRKCGADIMWNSFFSGKTVFPHGITGVFISGDAQIGKDCVIFQQVTIGSNRTSESKHYYSKNSDGKWIF